MKTKCPKCYPEAEVSESRTRRAGRYRRKSDCQYVQMFFCHECNRSFIRPNKRHGQLKRQMNDRIFKLYSSGVSQRRIAFLLHINRKTVAKKLMFLGLLSKLKVRVENLKQEKVKVVFFDDLETFEHTKLKPLSVTIANSLDRRFLDLEVSQMPATGLLAKKSVEKYGYRKDMRSQGRRKLFKRLKDIVADDAIFFSDQNPHYPKDLKEFFPNCTHITFKGRRGAVTGQGELKKIGFDPLFPINHACAMLRANVNRLFRKTWCTTKLSEKLALHLAVYMEFHNLRLLKQRK